jgi:hypothetical protein
MGTAPLLLVHKSDVSNPVVEAPPAHPTAPAPQRAALNTSGAAAAVLDDDFEVPVRRRWGLVAFVLLVLSGAVTVGVLAFLKQQEAVQGAMEVPIASIPSDTEAGPADASADDAAATDAQAKPTKRTQLPAAREARETADRDRTKIDGKSILEPNADKPAPSPAADPPKSDNPYSDAPTPAPKPSVDPVLGY